MKVGFDGRYAEGNLVGIGRYINNLVRGLTKNGVEVTVFYSKKPKIEIPKTKEVILKSKSRYFYEQILLPRAIKEAKVDLYHAPGNVGIPLFLNTPSVLTVNDIIPLTFEGYFQNSKFPLISRQSYAFRIASSCFFASKIISVSNYTKKLLVQKMKVNENKIKVIYQGVTSVNSNLKLPGELKKGTYILNNRGIDIRKNQARLIEAFSLIENSYPELKLVITGENKAIERELRKLVKTLKLSDKVYFTGYISEKFLWTLLNNAKCLCYPSLVEGFGFPVIEGLKARVPVISSNLSSTLEIAKGQAMLVNPYNTNEIAHALKKVLDDKKFVRKLIRGGEKIAMEYDWVKTVNETMKIYEETLR